MILMPFDAACNNCGEIKKIVKENYTIKINDKLCGVYLCQLCKKIGLIDMDKIIKDTR